MSTDRSKKVQFICHAEASAVEPTEVWIGPSLQNELASRITQILDARPCAIIVDSKVLDLHGTSFLDVIPVKARIPVAGGEQVKCEAELVRVCRELVRAGLRRDGAVVAIGGGATLDLAGLAASLHMRGVPVAHVPTTLLAMVDASLGGKTAINLPEGKNLLGSFHQPRFVLVDPLFLATLSEEDFLAGLGEVAKYAIGFSRELFQTLMEQESLTPSSPAVPDIIEQCLREKARIVEQDPLEQSGVRALLNLGHSSAHAFEAAAAARGTVLSHGLAVALGLRVALQLASELGEIDTGYRDPCLCLLDSLGLPRELPDSLKGVESSEYLEYLLRDKKGQSDALAVVLPVPEHACIRREVEAERLIAWMQSL